LATKHAYEAVLLKEAQKNERGDFHKFNPGFTATYEQWLRDRGLDGEAEAWRHRKDENYFRLEISGEGEARGDIDIKGLPGFKATAAWRGSTRFYRGETPGVTAFIDTGQKIRVYQSDDETILAALQLGQQKWGGVQVNGTDEYKRRCAGIAAKYGIRITNPEPRDMKPQERHDAAERAKATEDKKAETAPIHETAVNAKTPDSTTAQDSPNMPAAKDIPMEMAPQTQQKVRPMRLAERQKANGGIIAALRSRQEEIEGILDTETKAIADAAIKNLKNTADEKRKRLEEAKAATASAVREIETNPPAKGLFGFGYAERKKEWDKLLNTVRADDARAEKTLEGHGKALEATIAETVDLSKKTARNRNTEAVKEIEAINAEIARLNADINGIYAAAKSLLWHSEYHRFGSVRFSEKGEAYRGEIIGVAEHNGYTVILQDGPIERFESESESKDMYGRPLIAVNHVIWAHEISPEQAPEVEALTGNVATIAVGVEGEIEITDVLTKNQEWERSHGHGFSR
jgi:uncharacterized protein (UPF0335 family)